MGNWADYDRSLVGRGSLTIWLSPDAIRKWNALPTRCRGGQRKYSDLAIETAVTLRLLFRLPLRQVEGFLRSLFDLMGLALDVPDHTTLWRRGKRLRVPLRLPLKLGRIYLVFDSSGLGIFGEGEWAAVKHDGKVRRVIGEGAYDSRELYDAAISRGAKVVVPPIKTAQTGGRGCRARDLVVRCVRKVGRRQWKKESGYHQQARAENTFFRYKRILGDRLHSRDADAQVVEARLACNILNRMVELGMPASYAVRM
ncbi:MAG: hypothetical protein ACJAYX_003140 [Planctomycetota bacterium]|jgi:hypothetical protein